MAGKIQNEDIKSSAELVSGGGSAANLPNADKIYITSLSKTLAQAYADGNFGQQLVQGSDSTTGNIDALDTSSNSSIRLTGAAPTLRGIANGSSGKLLVIMNASGVSVTVSNQNATPTAANRIITGTAADITLANDASLLLQYDSTTSRWRVIGGSGSGGSSAITQGSDSSTGNIDALDTSVNFSIRLTGAAPALRGIANGVSAKVIYVMNASGVNINVSNEHATPTAANRIITGEGADVTLKNGAAFIFHYDSTTSRWRIIGETAATGSGTETTPTAYTPTITGLGTVTNVSFFHYLSDSGLFRYVYGSFTNGTVAASLASISLPGADVVDPTYLSLNNTTANPGNIAGEWVRNDNANQRGCLVTAPATDDTVVYFAANVANNGLLTPQNGNDIMASGAVVAVHFKVPVA